MAGPAGRSAATASARCLTSTPDMRLPGRELDAGVAEGRRGQRDPDEPRLDFLAEGEALAPDDVAAAGPLPGDGDLEPMVAGRDVARVDALNPSPLQRLQLLEAVDVLRDELAVDLDLHRVEPELLALGDRDEDGDLRVGRIEELLLEAV